MTEQPTMAAALSDARAAHRTAAESADRYRDVVSQVLGLNENPGDDELVARLLAAHGMAGAPESTRWRDFLGTAKMQLGEAGIRFSSDLDPQELGVGSDQDAPSAPQERLQAAEQADPVAQYPPKRLRASEAVPDDVLQAGRAAAWPGLPVEPIDYDQANRRADAATRIAWQAAHRLFSGMIAYEVTCLRCAQQLDQLAAERAAGIEEGRREAARELERRFSPYLHPSEPGRDTADDMRIRAARIASGDDTWARETDDEGVQLDGPFPPGSTMHIAGYRPSTEKLDELMAQVDDDVRKLVTDTEIPPHLIPPDGATSAAEFARIQDNDPVLTALRARAGAGNPGIEQMFTGPIALARGDQLRAQLDRSLALLHNVLDDHWLGIPGRPAGQPGAMRILGGGQLAGWRQRMAAIEEEVAD
jgi:hypothetical protein